MAVITAQIYSIQTTSSFRFPIRLVPFNLIFPKSLLVPCSSLCGACFHQPRIVKNVEKKLIEGNDRDRTNLISLDNCNYTKYRKLVEPYDYSITQVFIGMCCFWELRAIAFKRMQEGGRLF